MRDGWPPYKNKKVSMAPRRIYLPVLLSEDDYDRIVEIMTRGFHSARVIARARVLSKLSKGLTHAETAKAVELTVDTVRTVHARFNDGGLETALYERARPGQAPKLDAKQSAHITAIACSAAPEGHSHWTLRLLAGKVMELGYAESFSYEGVRALLKKTPSGRNASRSGASRKSTKNT
jgi:transposase